MKLNKKDLKSLELTIDNATIAISLAAGCGNDQGGFLSVFSKELKNSCQDNHRFDLQLIAIADRLDANGQELIIKLHSFITENKT